MRKSIAKAFNSDMGSGQFDVSGKDRLKWTEELHDLFEKAVTRLGGPDRATPKGIKRDMGIPELTIYHVKSHLQGRTPFYLSIQLEYKGLLEVCVLNTGVRLWGKQIFSTYFLPLLPKMGSSEWEYPEIGFAGNGFIGDEVFFLALKVQRSLKRDIEAQRRYLERIAEDIKTRVVSIANSSNKAFSPKSLPSFCEDSARKPEEFESDSEIYKTELWYQEESRAPKRPRTEGNANLLQKYMVASVLDYT
ncbi:hypothetical protein Vadar_020423 [Vaccinium darrowii]|uniref:Uncharacterized protein n=1 Tax=Vaccinium darrowii TaxID=229202 RepID=A0ACB7XS30_9ERIC|nr:hypothetical protein Vadar_020423 [Vaccinium darrowii]